MASKRKSIQTEKRKSQRVESFAANDADVLVASSTTTPRGSGKKGSLVPTLPGISKEQMQESVQETLKHMLKFLSVPLVKPSVDISSLE